MEFLQPLQTYLNLPTPAPTWKGDGTDYVDEYEHEYTDRYSSGWSGSGWGGDSEMRGQYYYKVFEDANAVLPRHGKSISSVDANHVRARVLRQEC